MTNRQAAIEIIRRLQQEGYEALLAGGCVRDMLLGRRAKDYDVATNARPEEVMRLFRRTLKVGAKFGVVIVLARGRQVEVATFRSETGYEDGRHPGAVRFTSAAEDASRRDFTINGMFYDPLRRRVIDYVDGQADLERRIVRTIGDPKERFGEDYLRMLRAIRFSARLDFEIEAETLAAIRRYAPHIANISGERICIEVEGILCCPNRAAGASMLSKTGLLSAIFPGLEGQRAARGRDVLAQLRSKVDLPLALASLFASCPIEFALERCRVLKLSKSHTRQIKFLLAQRGRLLDFDMRLAQLKQLLAGPYFWDLYELERAIQKATGARAGLEALGKLRRRIRALGDINVKPDPLLTGHDLIRLGAVPGPSLGQLSEELYIAQLEGEVQTPAQAEQWAQSWLQRHEDAAR
jgi:poly(A) polymerase